MGELLGAEEWRGLERGRSCGHRTKSSGGASKHPQAGFNTSKALIPVSHWEFLSSLKDLFLLLSLIPKSLEGSNPLRSSLGLLGLMESSRNKEEGKPFHLFRKVKLSIRAGLTLEEKKGKLHLPAHSHLVGYDPLITSLFLC